MFRFQASISVQFSAVVDNLDIIAAADWIIDIGPEAGHDGGQVVYEGTPDQMITDGGTHTAEHLRAHAKI